MTMEFKDVMDAIKEVILDPEKPKKKVQVGSRLIHEKREKLVAFLKEKMNYFAWDTSDMSVIDPKNITHKLNVDPSFKPVK